MKHINSVIATFGEILVEIITKKQGQTFLQIGTYTDPYPSGAPAIFINQAALLGASTRIYSMVGEDDFGNLNILYLKKAG